jgi:hypothetical protein
VFLPYLFAAVHSLGWSLRGVSALRSVLLAYKEVSLRLWPEEAAWSAAAVCSKVMPCPAMRVRNFGRGRPADAVSVLALLVVDGPDAQVPDDLGPVQDDLMGKGSRAGRRAMLYWPVQEPDLCTDLCTRRGGTD